MQIFATSRKSSRSICQQLFINQTWVPSGLANFVVSYKVQKCRLKPLKPLPTFKSVLTYIQVTDTPNMALYQQLNIVKNRLKQVITCNLQS